MSIKKSNIKRRLVRLFSDYLKGKSSEAEQDFVDKLYDSLDQYAVDDKSSGREKDAVKRHIDRYINDQQSAKNIKEFPYVKVVAAIVIIALTGLFAVFIWFRQDISGADGTASVPLKKPIPAFSIVKDGQTFDLNSMVPEGTFIDMINDEKVLVIQALSKKQSDFHTIRNASKEILSVLLTDGSQVWLDADAEITFAHTFNQTSRYVSISGEAYFDVRKSVQQDKHIPFIVRTNLQEIEVLGTQFNVNARKDGEQSVTLIEGKVKLKHQKYTSEVVMQPNQMATLSDQRAKILVTRPDQLDKVLAWRKGLFYFEEESLKDVMAELSKWYEKEIVVDQGVAQIRYSGILSRYPDLDSVLDLLQLTEDVEFTTKGGKIYVKGHSD